MVVNKVSGVVNNLPKGTGTEVRSPVRAADPVP
jgi:hypothetical protein